MIANKQDNKKKDWKKRPCCYGTRRSFKGKQVNVHGTGGAQNKCGVLENVLHLSAHLLM